MKFNFWKAEAPVVENEEELNEKELRILLKEYGGYSFGNTDAVDNEKRNQLLKNIFSKIIGLSEEKIEKICADAHLVDSEKEDLLYLIREQRMKRT
jgi:Mn-dependent DtxR family transcriptional regulator